MSQQEHTFFATENGKEESPSTYTQHYEASFYPAHQKLRPERNVSVILGAILAVPSVLLMSRFLLAFFNPSANSPWPIFGLLNISVANFLFYLLIWQTQRKPVYSKRLITFIAWLAAIILVFLSPGAGDQPSELFALFLAWPLAILILSLLFRLMIQRSLKASNPTVSREHQYSRD